jgi:hypothetical protein
MEPEERVVVDVEKFTTFARALRPKKNMFVN